MVHTCGIPNHLANMFESRKDNGHSIGNQCILKVDILIQDTMVEFIWASSEKLEDIVIGIEWRYSDSNSDNGYGKN